MTKRKNLRDLEEKKTYNLQKCVTTDGLLIGKTEFEILMESKQQNYTKSNPELQF